MRLSHVAPGIVAASVLALLAPTTARADSGLDTQENGAQQLGRAGAWLARGDDPLAAFYNPAALVLQATSVHLGAHLMFQKSCFGRVGPDGQPVSPGADPGLFPGPGTPNGGPATPSCTSNGAFPNPQIAATFRISKNFAVGLAVMGPHGAGKQSWPESVSYTNKFGVQSDQPAPNRYLLVSSNSLLLFPTISASYAITDRISVGAGFIWGIASVQYSNFAETVSPAVTPGKIPGDDFAAHQDVKATLSAKDLFIPGFILSGLWQATDNLDISGWYKWMDAVKATTDLSIRSQYWLANGTKNPGGDVAAGQPNENLTSAPGRGTVKLQIPMEAKLGLRYHQPRKDGAKRPDWATSTTKPVRDPMSQDLFDVELDFTWSHNSSIQNLELRFDDGIKVAGTPGFVPVNGDIPHNYRDVLGVRLGGEVVPVPGLLALRAGGFFESKGQDDQYLNFDFNLATHVGLAGGATVRVGPVDLAVAYQHIFYGTLDNGGQGAIHALSGDATTGNYRSVQIVNGGKLTANMNEVALGGTYHF